ncbi:MAG TPA: gamma-glutamylcyclotransferase [Azospirillaceae bacterium]|nr:gamma-glutamylcyclotransferase [Azospirillaceae bacterium]
MSALAALEATPATPARPEFDHPPGTDLWVFGYGSLMWNPGFAFAERQLALLRGYHRRFCILSHRYRGTVERPGLVLGLDRGGSCWGMAFRVEAAEVPGALAYLWDREMVTRAYRPRLLPVRMPQRRTVRACTFVADPGHPQYSDCRCREATAERIAAAAGRSGSNIDYLANTVAQLEQLGIRDRVLIELLGRVRTLTQLHLE